MARKTGYEDWMQLAFEGWRLWFEASGVIGLRMLRLAHGGALAQREAQRMMSEKVDAALWLGPSLVSKQSSATPTGTAKNTVRHYRKRVTANRRRLTR